MSSAPQSPEPRSRFPVIEGGRGYKGFIARYRVVLVAVGVAFAVAGALIHKSPLVILGIIMAAVALNGCG